MRNHPEVPTVKLNFHPLKTLYDQNAIHDKALRRDLSLFIYSVSAGTVFFAISTGTPFTGLAVALGANDLFYSLLFAIPISTSVLQFFASWLMERTRQRKVIFIISGLIQRSLWIPVALVPLFVPMGDGQLRLWAIIGLTTLSSLAGSFMNVTFFSWLGDVVPLRMRGRYLGVRSSISTVLGLLSAFAASLVLDAISGLQGYVIVFGVGALFGITDIATFFWIRDPGMVPSDTHYGKALKAALHERPFLIYLLFWTAWIFTWNLSGPFFTKYCLDHLRLNLTITTLAGQVAGGLMTFLFIQRWGHLLDSHGFRWVLLRSGLVGCLTSLVWLFAAPGQFWPLLVFSLLNGVFVCGVDVTSVQMLVSVTPQQNRSIYIAIYMVVTSVLGSSLGYLCGGALLDWMGDLRFQALGIAFDRYKVLFTGASVLRLGVILALLPYMAGAISNHAAQELPAGKEG